MKQTSPSGARVGRAGARSAVRRQLDRIDHSAGFAGSRRLMTLLRHLVEETLEGRGGGLVESAIGNALYHRDPPYDPRIDSTVRVEIRRLRRKLAAYYAGEGRADAIRIDVPVGGYTPLFSEASTGASMPLRPPSGQSPDGDGRFEEGFEPGGGALVAIMPLRAINRGARAEAFAAGLTQELAFVIGQEPGLTVVSGAPILLHPREEVAARLGVDLFVDGTVRMSGGRVRVTVEVSYVNGILAWADRIDAPAMENLRLQEIVATTLISHVRVDNSLVRSSLVRPKAAALARNARVNQARLLLNRQTSESLGEARSRFSQLTESFPDYSRVHSGLADALLDLYRLDLVDAAVAGPEARKAAERALACDRRSSEAHAALAGVVAWMERRPLVALTGFDRAIALDGGVRAFRGRALLMAALGRSEEAREALTRARRLEPISPLLDATEALCHFHARRFEEGEELRRLLDRGPGPVPFEVSYYAAVGLAIAGDRRRALELLPALGEEMPDCPVHACAVDEIRALAGAEESGGRPPFRRIATHYGRAALHAARQQWDDALSELGAAAGRREAAVCWLAGDPRFAGLRSHQAWQTLVGAVWQLPRSSGVPAA